MTKQHGLLLTRNSHDHLNSTELQFWLATDKGPVLLRVPGERAIFFIRSADQIIAKRALQQAHLVAEIKLLQLQTFQGQTAAGVYTNSIHSHFRAQESLRSHDITLYEADIRLHDRYLMERFICAGITFDGDSVQKKGYVEIRQARLKPSDYSPTLRHLSIDIECDMTNELFCVGLSGCDTAEVLMIGVAQPDRQTEILWFDDEKQLLLALVERINTLDPDVLIGWNLINFDLRILLQRAAYHKVKFVIGRGNQLSSWRDLRGENNKGFISIPGRIAIDGIDALKTATYKFSSFSLENVAQTLLARGKMVEDDVNHRFAEIKHNFLHDKSKLAAYNLEDCRLVEDIFSCTQILDFLIFRSQITGLEIDRIGGSVAAFTNLYIPRLHRAGYVAPNLPPDGGISSPGGYVMDSKPGLYRNILVLDFKSLYPSIIRTFKIDPMGLIEGLKNLESSIEGFRGGKFHRKKHFLPQIITELWLQRDIAKKSKDAPRSQAIKILMNSFYGVLGSGGCRFYDARLASSITLRGHKIMQTTQHWIEERGYQVIYGDTDSIFVWIGGSPTRLECRQIGQQLASQINNKWREKLQQEFALECFLEIEFETHFKRFLMPTIRGADAGSKKRYAGLIELETELQGTSARITEKMVFKGLENVRTDWTQLAKTFQAELYELIFHDQDPIELIKGTVGETLAGKRDHQLIYRRQLRRNLDSYVKNVPPHVKAARLADEGNRKFGKPLRYQHKGWINYVVTVSGPEPIEYQNNFIDYQQYVDKQLKPIADAILPFIDMDFDSIISNQTEIF